MENIKQAEVLQETYQTPSSKYDGIYSKTAQFMIPAIGIKITNPLVFKYFVNAYLTDMNHEHNYTRPIFILFSIKDYKEKNWLMVYNKLITSKNFITEYDVGIKNNNFLLMMVFQVPEEFEQDYINFKIGRYSRFSEKYKQKFPEFLDDKKTKKNIHWQIINKDEDLKRDIEKDYGMDFGELDKPTIINKEIFPPAEEIWDKPDKKRENYNYKATL